MADRNEQPELEGLDSGEWTAAAVAHRFPELYAEITDGFLLIDPREITKDVLDHPLVDAIYVIQALDDVYGEVADPYAAEDDI